MYSRFENIRGFEQSRLEGSEVAVIGLGTTGSKIAEHLARHGVNLKVFDRDFLEPKDMYTSNYTESQVDRSLPKAVATEELLSQFTDVEAHVENVDSSVIKSLDVDLVMDGTDNLQTRKVIDQTLDETPWVFTSVLANKGFSMFMQDQCLSCLMKKVEPKSSCQEHGVMREVASISSSQSSLKAVKYLSGLEVSQQLDIAPSGRSLEFEGCNCSKGSISVTRYCSDGKYQIEGEARPEDFQGEVLQKNDYLVKLKYKGIEFTVFDSGRAVIPADSREEAKDLYIEASGL